MIIQILPAKYVQERITVNVDAAEFITGSISSVTCSVDVYYGEDPNPQSIFRGGAFFVGSIVSQVIEAGLPGVIYELLFAITCSTGEIVEITCRQAVLPTGGSADISWLAIPHSSRPYPVEASDPGFISFGALMLLHTYDAPHGEDYINAACDLVSINLYGGTVTLAQPWEDSVEALSELVEIELYGGAVTLVQPWEDSEEASSSLISIDLYGNSVAFTQPWEDSMESSSSLQSIELVDA